LRISDEWGKYLIEETENDHAGKLLNLRTKIKNYIELEGHKLVENILIRRRKTCIRISEKSQYTCRRNNHKSVQNVLLHSNEE
jgi:hypothetical protein